MTRQPLQSAREIYEPFHLRICVISSSELSGNLQRLIKRHAKLHGNHLCNRVTARIGQIQNAPHIAHDSLRCQSTEGDDLHHAIRAVLSSDVVYDLLSPLICEIHVNIRHRDALRIQKALKDQLIADGLDIRNSETIGNHGTRRGASARSHGDAMGFRIIDIIPDDQEVIHISHAVNNLKLLLHSLTDGGLRLRVALFKSFLAESLQVVPGVLISLRNLIGRKLQLMKTYIYLAALCDFLRIIQCLRRIGKERAHLLLRFQIILPALVAHAVSVRHLFPGLKAEQQIMRLRILCIGIVGIIACNKFYAGLS